MTATAKAALFAQQTSEIFLPILDISHTDFDDTFRVVLNTESVTSNGNTYEPFPFLIDMPDETDDGSPNVTLTICNVDQQIVELLRSVSDSVTIELNIILESDPDTVEAGPFTFDLLNIKYDAFVVQGNLGYEGVMNEPFPGHKFTPDLFPALF